MPHMKTYHTYNIADPQDVETDSVMRSGDILKLGDYYEPHKTVKT